MTRPSSGLLYKSVRPKIPKAIVRSCLIFKLCLDQRSSFEPISQKLLYAQGAPLRHIPLKIYLPSSPTASEPTSGHLRVVQSLITPNLPNTREPQSLGAALNTLLPALFPSRRTPILAKPVLHGAVVPMTAQIETLLREASYLDGWLHLGVVMMG